MKKSVQGSLYILLATIIWGSSFVSQSIGMDHIGPFTFQAIRCGLAVIGLLPVIWIADRFTPGGSFVDRWKNKQLWKAGLLCGLPLFLAVNLQQVAIVDTDAGKSAFLTAMYIIFVPIIGFFCKKKISKLIPVSIVLAVAGLYCLSCVGVTSISKGDFLLLGCAFMFAVQIMFADKYAGSLDALRLNLIQSLVCTVLSFIVMCFTEKPTWSGISACWLPLAHVGFLSMGAAYSLQIIGQKYLESSIASLIMSMESVFAVLFGWLILHERLSKWEIIGCVLVFIAVILSQIPDKPRNKQPAQKPKPLPSQQRD